MTGLRTRRLGFFTGLLTALFLTLSTAALGADQSPDPASIVKHENTSYNTQSPEAIWTLERIRAAKPMPQPAFTPPPASLEIQEAPQTSQTIVLPPSLPVSLAHQAVQGLDGPSYQTSGDTDCPASDYSYGVVEAQNTWPLVTTGKVVTILNGQSWLCSAAVVGPGLILTAAHCVHNNGWITDLAFIPALDVYDDNPQPWGVWTWESILTFNAWTAYRNIAYDLAFVKLAPKAGHHIHEYTGHLGMVFGGDPSVRQWLQLGYPVKEFDGLRMFYNSSAYGYRDYRFSGSGSPMPVGVGSGMSPGASGGPWILNQDGGYYANGVNSYSPPWCEFHTAFSPYMGLAAYILARAALED